MEIRDMLSEWNFKYLPVGFYSNLGMYCVTDNLPDVAKGKCKSLSKDSRRNESLSEITAPFRTISDTKERGDYIPYFDGKAKLEDLSINNCMHEIFMIDAYIHYNTSILDWDTDAAMNYLGDDITFATIVERTMKQK